MAKKVIEDENINNDPQPVEAEDSGKKKRKKEPLQKSEEELYVETLSKEERKEYNRRKRALRRSQWLAEYWIIIVLAVAVFVVFCLLMAINYFDLSAADFFAVKPFKFLKFLLKH